MGGGRLCLGGDGSGGSVVHTTTIQKKSLEKHKLTESVFHKEDRLRRMCYFWGFTCSRQQIHRKDQAFFISLKPIDIARYDIFNRDIKA